MIGVAVAVAMGATAVAAATGAGGGAPVASRCALAASDWWLGCCCSAPATRPQTIHRPTRRTRAAIDHPAIRK